MVRVLAVADEEVPAARARARNLQVDLVLGAGDLPWDYLESIVSELGAPGAYVPGNHDPREGTTSAPRGMVNVDEQVVELGGLRIAGLGGSVRHNDGHHQFTQKQFDQRARGLLESSRGLRIDVLLTHAPPHGLGDETDPCHVGIAALHDVIESLQPTWHIHGHIHPYGMHKPDRQLGRTTIRNVIPWQVLEIEPQPTEAVAGRRG